MAYKYLFNIPSVYTNLDYANVVGFEASAVMDLILQILNPDSLHQAYQDNQKTYRLYCNHKDLADSKHARNYFTPTMIRYNLEKIENSGMITVKDEYIILKLDMLNKYYTLVKNEEYKEPKNRPEWDFDKISIFIIDWSCENEC